MKTTNTLNRRRFISRTGRKEPGTGEINYRGVFKYIHDRSKRENRDFVVGMEHGNSKPGKPGEQAVIQDRDADAF